MNTYGLGYDVVDTAAFVEQLTEPGSRMYALFSAREVWRASDCARQKDDGEAIHLAAKWAGKETFLKAWYDYLGDALCPFTLDDFLWPETEILDDSRGVPHVPLNKGAASVFQADYANSAAGARYSSAYSSASDNGLYAMTQEWRNARSAQHSAFGAGSMPYIHVSLSHGGPIVSAMVTISVKQRRWLGESWVTIVEPVRSFVIQSVKRLTRATNRDKGVSGGLKQLVGTGSGIGRED